MSVRRFVPLSGLRRFTAANNSTPIGAAAPDSLHGSQHWLFERLLSMTSLGLIAGAMVLPDSAPTAATSLLNFALGTVIPLHCHIGFGAVITDYLPRRKFPLVYGAARVMLWVGTSLTLYGLYRFNTEDAGIIEGVKTLWHCKAKQKDEEN